MIDAAKETAKWHASMAWTTVTITKNGRAVMPLLTFLELDDYSRTLPSGQYIGKRWKRLAEETWWMGEYVDDPNPDQIGIVWSPIDVHIDHGTPDQYTIVATVRELAAVRVARALVSR